MALSPDQDEFLDWLLLPEPKIKQNEWARQHGLKVNTVSTWKKQKEFVEEWRIRADDEGVGPLHIMAVRDAMYQKAKAGDTKAADLYYKYARITAPYLFADPEEPEVPVEQMTDEAIREALGASLDADLS